MEAKDLQTILEQQFVLDGDDLTQKLEVDVAAFLESPDLTVQNLLRSAHNLKGSAQLSGYTEFAKRVHDFESVLEGIKNKNLGSQKPHIGKVLAQVVTLVVSFFNCLKDGANSDPRDEGIWHNAFESLKTMTAPLVSNEAVAASDVVREDALDDWGLGQLASKNVEPAERKSTTAATDFSKGWGLFEDESPSLGKNALEAGDLSPQVTASLPLDSQVPVEAVAKVNAVLASKKLVESMPDISDYLLCRNQGQSFALSVDLVQEIMPNQQVKKLPVDRDQISGVISFRGRVMAILNVFDRGVPADAAASNRCIVVCQIGTKQFGFRVDEVVSVLAVKRSQLQPVPGHQDANAIVQSLAQIDGRTVSFVDPSLVLCR